MKKNLIVSIAIFINVAGNAKNVIATAASLTILSVAMNLFAAAIIKMGNMSWGEMGRGLISLGSALGIVTLALIALPKDIFIKSLALMDVAGAMILLSQALKAFLEKPAGTYSDMILMDIMRPVMNEHLTKPLKCEKLIATIVKFL